MKNKPIQKNLKHGYIFLSGIILIFFALSLSTEIYLKGGFTFAKADNDSQEPEVVNERKDEDNIFLEIQNLTDGFKTEDETITVVAFTNTGNTVWINGTETEVNHEGVLEDKVDLIIGNNEIIIEAENKENKRTTQKITVIREKKEEPKEERQESSQNNDTNKPVQSPVNDPIPQPVPTPEPDPQPIPIMGLKLQCSITNTQPFIGQSASLDCLVKDQNSNPVSGATGNVTVNWQSGSKSYSLSNSNGSGTMNVSFTVPEGNSGHVSGSVRVSKDGLTVTSNFSLTIQ